MGINIKELREKLKDWDSTKKEEAVHICEQLCYDLDLARIPYRRTPNSEIEWITKSQSESLSQLDFTRKRRENENR